jgi:dUTP pyrophosphatase
VAFDIPKGYVGLIYPRSSIYKQYYRLANCVGVIDSGYQGEIMFVFDLTVDPNWILSGMWNVEIPTYEVGDRVGQIVFQKLPEINLSKVKQFTRTDVQRGSGGFGHTGK